MSKAITNTTNNNAFYQNHFHKVLIALVVLILIVIALVLFVLYEVHHRAIPPYYAIAQNGKRMTLVQSEQPNLLPVAILKWATKAATTAYTFDFNQTDGQLRDNISPYFTDLGWQSYWSAVQGTLKTIRQNKLYVSSVVSGTPVISNQGELPGKGIVKRVQLPFLITFESSESKSTKRTLVTLTLVRVPTTQNPTAMAIDQFVMR